MEKHRREVLGLAEKVGYFMEYWGFKQVHGRVWTLMFLSPEPIDANFLQKHLEISKALTSMTLKDLVHYKVIFEVEKGQPGTQKYRINENITEVILDVIRNREINILDEALESHKALESACKKDGPQGIDEHRLGEVGDMIEMAHSLLSSMVSLGLVDFNEFKEFTSVE